MSQLYLENKAYLLAKYEAWLKTVAPTHKIEKFSDRMKEGIQRCEAAEPNGVLATMGTHDNKGLSDLTKLSLSKAAEHLQPLEWANVNGAANDGLMGFMSREWLEASQHNKVPCHQVLSPLLWRREWTDTSAGAILEEPFQPKYENEDLIWLPPTPQLGDRRSVLMMGSSALLHGSDKQPIWLCGDGGSGTKEEFAGIVLEVGLGDSLLNMPAARIVMLDDYRDDESAYDHLIKAYEIDSRRNRNKHPATVINFMFRPVDTESDNEIELGDIHGVPLLTGSPKLLGPALEQLNEQFSVSTTDIDMKKIVTAIAD